MASIDPPVFVSTPVVVTDGTGLASTDTTLPLLEASVVLPSVSSDTTVVAGVFFDGKMLGRTEAASQGSAKGVAFAKALQVASSTTAAISVYSVGEDNCVSTGSFIGSASVAVTGKEDGATFDLLDGSGNKAGTLRLDQAGSSKDKFEGVAAAAAPAAAEAKEEKVVEEPLPEGPLFDKDESDCPDKYKTMDNDCVHGWKIPSLDCLEFLNAEAGWGTPEAGKPMLLLFWAQYHKPGYKFFPMYSKLRQRYGDKLTIVGVSVDPDSSKSPKKFLADPAKKYSSVFTTNFTVAWGRSLKEPFAAGIRDTLSLPHAFLVDGEGVVRWHQDHSQIGATAPTFMDLMETQVKALLEEGKVTSVGAREVDSEEEEEEEDEGDEGDEGEDMDNFF